MAFVDTSLQLSTAQAITSTAASSVIYDVTGAGSGVAPNLVFGTTSVFGADMGAGDGEAGVYIYLQVSTAFVSGGGATLQVQVQAAIDNGSNAPSSYTTIDQTGTFTAAQLTAGATLRLRLQPITIGESVPRFYRLNYVVATSTFSAGAVNAYVMLNAPSGTLVSQYPSNFASA